MRRAIVSAVMERGVCRLQRRALDEQMVAFPLQLVHMTGLRPGGRCAFLRHD